MAEHHEPPDPDSLARASRGLTNADIRWDGTTFGLVPTVVGASARRLLAAGEASVPPLVHAVEDEARFVAAHVVLTLVSGVDHQAIPWNGLEVGLEADGRVEVDAAQRFELARRWRTWQGSSPRPRLLPE